MVNDVSITLPEIQLRIRWFTPSQFPLLGEKFYDQAHDLKRMLLGRQAEHSFFMHFITFCKKRKRKKGEREGEKLKNRRGLETFRVVL